MCVCVPEHALFGLTLRAESHPRIHHRQTHTQTHTGPLRPARAYSTIFTDSETTKQADREDPFGFREYVLLSVVRSGNFLAYLLCYT